MITSLLIDLYNNELDKLNDELMAYESDELIWKTVGENKITAGNNCLIISGIMQQYIGSMIGEFEYMRNKEAELKAKHMSKERLSEEIANTRKVVIATLEEVSKMDLMKIYPTTEFTEPVTTEYYLLHLLKTLSFYNGQIAYHRQLTASK
jgi:hypothetical protein